MITVIIPTLAQSVRREELHRAIASAGAAANSKPKVIVVVNGDQADETILRELKQCPGLELHRMSTGSLPLALQYGRRQAKSELFCFLDDDDEFLPGGLDIAADSLLNTPDADYAVSNGYRYLGGQDVVWFQNIDSVAHDPLRTLFRSNWLASCSGLFKSKRIDCRCFENVPSGTEWTWIAFCLAIQGKRMVTVDRPVFRIHDTPASASKSRDYRMSYISLFYRMLQSDVPRDVRAVIKRRLSESRHDMSVMHLEEGAILNAWRNHILSLDCTAGWMFLPYTRHLISAPFRALYREQISCAESKCSLQKQDHDGR